MKIEPDAKREAELNEMGMGFFNAGPVSADISPAARRAACAEHPNAASYPAFGYAGGGDLGPYLRCAICHVVFKKGTAK